MASALRVRVTWDKTVVEDRLFVGRRRVRIGSGPRATVAVPDQTGYVIVRLRGQAVEIDVEPGAAEAIEFPGGERIALDGKTRFRRKLVPPFGAGALTIGGALVELERVALAGEVGDRAMWAWAAAALVIALVAGSSYKLMRLCGEGERAQWGRPPPLSSIEVARVRVRIGPDGHGSTRPQAGAGLALHGLSHAPLGIEAAPLAVHRPRKKRLAARTPRHAERPSHAASNPKNVTVATRPGLGTTPEPQPQNPPEPDPRGKLLENAQSALLTADLRGAIDSFDRAAHEAPLDYDQLNWLGLAHYLTGEYGDAVKVWSQAYALDAGRADALNNLASVSKRRGDTQGELKYLRQALTIAPGECHASNSLALAEAKAGNFKQALTTLDASDLACGGHYAYTEIQRAGILALSGDRSGAFRALEDGLSRIDTLIPIKEYEVVSDLDLDPAFAPLRVDARFAKLVSKYLPRAAGWKAGG